MDAPVEPSFGYVSIIVRLSAKQIEAELARKHGAALLRGMGAFCIAALAHKRRELAEQIGQVRGACAVAAGKIHY